MAGKRRKQSRKLAVRKSATAAGVIAATAALGLATPAAPASAASDTGPDYTNDIIDYSNALNQFLAAQNTLENGFGAAFKPSSARRGGE